MTDETPAEAHARYLAEHEPNLPARYRDPGRSSGQSISAATLILSAILVFIALLLAWTLIGRASAETCVWIKGNISRKGVRIYHLPGTAAYAQTKIDEAKGERWFCSEDEAKAAGWRGVRIKEAPERSEKVANPFRQ